MLGAHAVVQWALPNDVAEVVAWHHQPGRAYEAGGQVAFTVALVRVANVLEYASWNSRDVNDGLMNQLAHSGDAAYLGLTAHWLVAAWPKFVAAADESSQYFA